MRLANVYTKTAAERWRAMVIGSTTMVAFLLMAMAVYRDIDLSIYTDLPEVFRSVVGIDEDEGAVGLAYNAVYSSYGGLVVFAVAVAIGAGAIAGEERRGTFGLLLASPVSRTHVLLAKAAVLITMAAVGVGVLWIGGLVVPRVLDATVTGQDVGALMVHMFAATLFFGFLALAVGAWSGNNGLAIAVAAGVMVLSFFAVGLLPLVEGLQDLVKALPWYYYTGSDPLVNGIDWGHVAVLLTGTVLLGVVALVGVNRRDLRESSTPVTLTDRLRAMPLTAAVVDRLAGSARVSSVWTKTASEHQGLLLVVGVTMFAMMGLFVGALYPAIDDALLTLGTAFPEELLALFGGGDLSTPEGFYQIETFGMMAPLAVMIVTIVIGSRAVAGEEENRTMGLLLANGVPRSKVVLQKAFVLILYAVLVGLATFLGVVGGNLLAGLGMSVAHIAATCALVVLLGIAFGGASLLIGAATGRARAAAWGAAGLALMSHLADAFLPFSQWAGLEKWTPNYYYLSADPLRSGMPWGHAAVLAALGAGLIMAAVPAFNRRDLRERG